MAAGPTSPTLPGGVLPALSSHPAARCPSQPPGLGPGGPLHPCPTSLSGPALVFPLQDSLPTDLSFSPSVVIAEAALCRFEMTHWVVIARVHLVLEAWGAGLPVGVCVCSTGARGSAAPPCGLTAVLATQLVQAEPTRVGVGASTGGRALGVVGDRHIIPGLSTE